MALSFFEKTRQELEKNIGIKVSDEGVKAFLHYTEESYKKNDNLLPMWEHRHIYEPYSFGMLSNTDRKRFLECVHDYKVYKNQQALRIEAVRFLEDNILPRLAKFSNQDTFGYHGLEHTELVAIRAVDIATTNDKRAVDAGGRSEFKYQKVQDLYPVMLAAAIHDCARVNNAGDPQHGPRAAAMPEVKRFLTDKIFGLTPDQQESIRNAAAYHTVAQPRDGKVYDEVQKVLCDADRARLSWEGSHWKDSFFTEAGDEMGAMNPYRVADYLQGWDRLMSKHGIRPVGGKLASKYAIRYVPKYGHKRACYVSANSRGNGKYNGR